MARLDQPSAPTEREAWKPHTPKAEARLSTLPPGHPFAFIHYPKRWTVDAEAGEILPELVEVSLQPGACNTGKEVRGGGGDSTGAMMSVIRRGATPIIDDLQDRISARLGGPLIARVPVRGGHVWLDYATDALAGTNRLRTNADRRLAMLLAVKAELPPPADHVLETLLEGRERDHAAASMDADRNPLKARERDRLQAEIDILRAALAPVEAPKTRKPRGRKPAAEEK